MGYLSYQKFTQFLDTPGAFVIIGDGITHRKSLKFDQAETCSERWEGVLVIS